MYRNFYLILFLLLPLGGLAQTAENGDINIRITNIISSMPGNSGDDYEAANNSELNAWEVMVTNILQGAYATANTQATQLGYDLIAFTDTSSSIYKLYYLLEEQNGNEKYWGTYLFNPDPARSTLVIQSPHPRADLNTGKEGIWVFHKLNALAFCLSGSHRCNHSSLSTCSGTSSICGSSSAYRITDMPHIEASIYQQTTQTILANVSTAYFVQLHGFGQQSADPEVIMSNGTRLTPAADPIAELRDGLFIADPALTFKIGHIDLSWNRLLGFTNTQGRMINNSADICNSNATATNGQFLHVEQVYVELRADTIGWNKMYEGLAYAFGEDSLTVEVLDFSSSQSFTIYPNPFSTELFIDLPNDQLSYTFELFDLRGSRLLQQNIKGPRYHWPIPFQIQQKAYFYLIRSAEGQIRHQGKILSY